MIFAIDLTSLNDNFSGIERYALNMTLEMLKIGQSDTFELIFKNEVFQEFLPWEEKKNVHFHVIPGCKKLLFNQWKLPQYMKKIKADYYLFFAFPMPVLFTQKHVWGTIHDLGCWDCPETMKKHMVWYFKISYWWMARKAEKLITVSRFSKSRIQDILKVSEEKILIAYNGIAENFQKEKYSTERKLQIREKYHLPEEYYLCLSTLEPRKNMILLLKTYLDLYKERKIKTKLVLAGRKGWKIDELLSETDAVNDGQVIVTGFIDDEDLPCVYGMAKCFVFPSIYEGFGIPPLEAMSQGVPVISSDASSLPEVLGDAAIYFISGDSEGLRQKLLDFELLSDKQISKYREKGIQQSRKFRYEKEARVLWDYFQKH